MTDATRLVFLIRQLNEGGAQRQLLALVRGLDKTRFEVTLVTFYRGGIFEAEAEAIPNVRLLPLDKSGRWDVLPFLWRLLACLRALRPELLHGYLPTANLLAVLLAPLLPRAHIVWGIRSSDMDVSRYDWLTKLHARLERTLVRWADLVVLNSSAARRHHVARGFPASKCVVIPNGIDLRHFSRDRDAGRALRAAWARNDRERLIGIVARLDPMKDHRTFLEAASLLRRERADVRFVCIGSGPGGYTAELQARARDLGLTDVIEWAGSREDVVAVYSALDVMTLCSSYGEGFPNVVAEAMACGTPCVVTDVGDAAEVVGDTGCVVPPGDPRALSLGWKRMLDRPSNEEEALRLRLRDRIDANYAIERLVARTEAVLAEVVRTGDPHRIRRENR